MHTIEKTDNTTTIRFTGNMKVERAGKAKAVVETALSESGSVLIDLEQVGDADLTFFQILCSAHRTARKVNKTFDIAGPVQAQFRLSLQGAGYEQTCALGIDTYKNCLWTKIRQ